MVAGAALRLGTRFAKFFQLSMRIGSERQVGDVGERWDGIEWCG